MKEIGGYFEWEDSYGQEYHPNLIPLNTGRNALLYICKIKEIKKLYLPYFLCDCIKNICCEHNIDISYYRISPEFLPVFSEKVYKNQALYVVNYFGQLDFCFLEELQQNYGLRVILDNTQAFFQLPFKKMDTIYSCRKFFGVPDGAYLKTDSETLLSLDEEKSRCNVSHILGRYEESASKFFSEYQCNENRICHMPIRHMSKISHNILRAIDYERACRIRTDNFIYLHNILCKDNKLKLTVPLGPFAYPFYHKCGIEIRKYLAKNRIYVPVLWPNILQEMNDDYILEYDYAANILPLPCDHRYTKMDMQHMINVLQRYPL